MDFLNFIYVFYLDKISAEISLLNHNNLELECLNELLFHQCIFLTFPFPY